MDLTTRRASESRALTLGATPLHRSRVLTALVAALLVLGVAGPVRGVGTAAAGDGPASERRVGHMVERVVVRGSTLDESRKVDVHVWYPADHQGLSNLPKSVYTSALNGLPLVPQRWDPLSWTVEAEIAREGAAIDRNGQAFPVIVFSHGSINDPIDYAHTLELIAGAGFVVAAPYHVNNTQDDVRIDYINAQAGVQLFGCNDGRPPLCSRTSVPRSMHDRVRDIGSILDALPGWFGDRVDVSRAGVLGHSRGTVTALAAAGGSSQWGFGRLADAQGPRVKAIMGMAIGAPPITFGVNFAGVDVPALLVAGTEDRSSPQAVSEAAFERIASTEKAFVSIEHATHRSFDSTYCAQMQAAAATFDEDGDRVIDEDELANPRRILDRHTVEGIVIAPPAGNSGRAREYCSFASFTEPTDIRPLVESLTGGIEITPDNVPSTGLETGEVKQGISELAVAFFGTMLKRVGTDGPHFTRYLAPKWLEQHEPMVDCAVAVTSGDAISPPGQQADCEN